MQLYNEEHTCKLTRADGSFNFFKVIVSDAGHEAELAYIPSEQWERFFCAFLESGFNQTAEQNKDAYIYVFDDYDELDDETTRRFIEYFNGEPVDTKRAGFVGTITISTTKLTDA